jgi:hypothetical protein
VILVPAQACSCVRCSSRRGRRSRSTGRPMSGSRSTGWARLCSSRCGRVAGVVVISSCAAPAVTAQRRVRRRQGQPSLHHGLRTDEANRADLGITFIAALPRITPLGDVGRPAVQAYAARSGPVRGGVPRADGPHWSPRRSPARRWSSGRGRCRHRRSRLRADRRRPREAAVTQATADQDVTSRRANTTAAAVAAAAT